jgi:hypothetical protein
MAIIDKPSDYFNTVLYTGDGTNPRAITGVGFQPDWVWNKPRSAANNHALLDSVRGATKFLSSDVTDAEYTYGNSIQSFDSDGFTSWNWKAGGTAVSNTDGSITSSVSANQEAGFSIVSYTGNSTAGSTIGHNLGVAPKMIIVKDRDGADSWVVYHDKLPTTEYLILNSSSAALTDNEIIFYDTKPTSSVFTVGAHNTVNQSGHNYIAYCFAEKQGFSRMGSYVGNGSSDGVFCYTGMKPSFVMIKRTDIGDNWLIKDIKRDPINQMEKRIFPNLSNAEDTGAGGFKLRESDAIGNASGGTYIYMAFAESPFVTSTGVPATAR